MNDVVRAFLPQEGQLLAPNISHLTRPVVQFNDGSIGTIFSQASTLDDGVFLYPRIREDGYVMSPQEAEQYFLDTGKHLGSYKTIEDADKAAEIFHKAHEKLYENYPKKLRVKGGLLG